MSDQNGSKYENNSFKFHQYNRIRQKCLKPRNGETKGFF